MNDPNQSSTPLRSTSTSTNSSPKQRRSYSPRSGTGTPRSRSSSSTRRSYSPRSRSRSRSYSPHHHRRRSSYSRSRSRSYSPSARYNRRSRSRSRGYQHYYSRSPPPGPTPQKHHRLRRSPPPRRFRSRSPQSSYRRSRPPPPASNPDCRVYVGNLPFEVSWHQLKDLMKEAGPVIHVDVLKSFSGRPKGCGVVEYQYPEDARRAIRTLNKVEFMGRPVFIREDRVFEHSAPPKDPRDAPDDCKLHVSNLPLNASWQDMKDLFRKAGRVLHTDVYTEPGTRRSNGHGTVIFDESRYARAAIDMFNGYEWQGHKLEVREKRYSDKSVCVTTTTTRPLPPPLTRPMPLPQNNSHVNSPSENVSSVSRAATPTTTTVPPPNSLTSTQTPAQHTTPTTTFSQQPQHLPTPPPPPPPTAYQNIYRHGTSDGSSSGPLLPPPPLHYIPLPPPLPPPFSQIGLVGGPEANTPTRGPNQIYVNNLPFSTTWQDLIDLFRHVGPVLRAEILNIKGHPKGAGFVRFQDTATCERAIDKFNGYVYGGRSLDIRLDRNSSAS